MRRLAAALLLCVLWAAPAAAQVAPLTVSVAYPGDGLVVISYTPPAGQAFACALRERWQPGLQLRETQLLGCDLIQAGELELGPGSVDMAIRVRPGDVVEVRSYSADGGAPFAVGRSVAGQQLYLPLAATP